MFKEAHLVVDGSFLKIFKCSVRHCWTTWRQRSNRCFYARQRSDQLSLSRSTSGQTESSVFAFSSLQSASDIFLPNGDKMWFWLESKNTLEVQVKKCCQYTLCAAPPKSVPVVLRTHTHTYSLLLPLRWSEERLGVFMLPTVLLEHGWMDGSQTEVVGERESEVEEWEARETDVVQI